MHCKICELKGGGRNSKTCAFCRCIFSRVRGILITIGPSRITQLIPQEFSGVAEVKFITPINSLRIFWCKRCVNFPNREKTEWCNFSWELRFLNPQNLFGVIGGETIALSNS